MALRSWLLAAVAFLTALSQSVQPAQAQTQGWPQRTVKFIVPLGPGSGADMTARLLAGRLSESWGKPVVIENRPGGDGFVAINAFVGARDDHTLLFSPSSVFTAHPFLYEKLPYDPQDLVPLARVTSTLAGVGVPASLKIATLAEFVALARAEPGKLNWAGITGALDFVFAGFLHGAGLNVNKIPYRDGVQALSDLGEGRIHAFLTALAVIRPQIEAGKVKLISIANQERAPYAPDVQTAIEGGHPSLTFDGLVGLFGSRDMSEELRNRIAADVLAVASDPVVVKQLEANSQLVRPANSSVFAAAIDVQRSQIDSAAKSLGSKPNR
ncbi:MAG: tripartite tricarboxylate transporter substrate binding protein [Hyphomicrobiales bacterium]|nr:tripartite tricarboxylate transporter substrate binding protein [Alphaproteobacteria bacterium]